MRTLHLLVTITVIVMLVLILAICKGWSAVNQVRLLLLRFELIDDSHVPFDFAARSRNALEVNTAFHQCRVLYDYHPLRNRAPWHPVRGGSAAVPPLFMLLPRMVHRCDDGRLGVAISRTLRGGVLNPCRQVRHHLLNGN